VLTIELIFITALYFAVAVLLLGLAWFFLERVFGSACIPKWVGMPSEYYRDAFFVAVFGSATVLGLGRLPALFSRWPLLRHSLDAAVPNGLDALNPAAGGVASAIWDSILITGIVGLLVGLIALYVRPMWIRVGIVILAAALLATNVASPRAFSSVAAFYLLAIFVLTLGVTRLVRFNVMGYFLLVAIVWLVPAAFELLEQPNSYFRANGYAVIVIALAILPWPLVHWRRKITSA
jgi:hypothetical protein